MSATAARAEGQPALRLVRPDAGPSPWVAPAVAQVLELYRRLPEWSPERAGALKLAGLAMKTLAGALDDRDWGLAAAALVILADTHTALERVAEDLVAPPDGIDVLDAIHEQYREALRLLAREQYEARRQAYRDGVNEGQRAFCEGRLPRRMKET